MNEAIYRTIAMLACIAALADAVGVLQTKPPGQRLPTGRLRVPVASLCRQVGGKWLKW
jgi:hypothetical protein